MKKFISAGVLSCSLALIGCGSDDIINFATTVPPAAAPTPTSEIGQISGDKFSTIFYQALPSVSGDYIPAFPTSGHAWDIDRGFAIDDGGGDSFDGALELSIQVGAGALTNFPGDASYPNSVSFGLLWPSQAAC